MRGYRWERWTEAGSVIWKAVPTVPRVLADYVECLAFLYPTVDHARRNDDAGGSGFLLGVECKAGQSELAHVYVVTNKHVIGRGSRVVRFTNRRGETEIRDLAGGRWVEADEDDVAVCPLDRLSWFSDIPMVRATALLAEDELEDDTATYRSDHPRYGDDVFMASRLASDSLRDGSVPAARFGTLISGQLAAVKTPPPLGFYQDSFLVEMRSIPGHSGSPVFLHYNDYTLSIAPFWQANRYLPGIRLLGVDWGHLKPLSKEDQADADAWNAGVACVVPAWEIAELLADGGLVKERKNAERAWEKSTRIGSGEGNADSLPADDKFGRFSELTQKLLNVPKTELDEKRRDDQT